MRRPHRKTRTGCAACKARRIKCDEEKPRCRNCANRDVDCTFAVPLSTPSGSQSTPSASSNVAVNSSSYRGLSQQPFSQSPRTDDHVSNDNTPGFAVAMVSSNTLYAGTQISGMNMLFLELLHNFTTSTCFTLSVTETMRTVWRVEIPRIAFSHEFVMQGILALSALHLAQFSKQRKDFYISQGLALHQSGLRTATALLSQVTAENCAALWVFNTITFLFSLASPRSNKDILLVGENGIAEWLQLIRGTQSMIHISEDHLRSSPLSSMFLEGRNRMAIRRRHANDSSAEATQLERLARLITDNCNNLAHLEHYIKAIDDLRASFNVAYAPDFQEYDNADVFIWLFHISNTYLTLLTQRTPESLAIFAHFCVVLKRFEGTWYVNGWSDHLMQRIYEMLDHQHRLWIRWPIEETGVAFP